MKRPAFAALLLLAALAVAGCDPRYGHRAPHGRREHQMDDRDAWEIVRRDPCRYEEYRRFAADHKNPDKRRKVVWRLAHEGCSRERSYDPNYR